jgi:hypothetical protein
LADYKSKLTRQEAEHAIGLEEKRAENIAKRDMTGFNYTVQLTELKAKNDQELQTTIADLQGKENRTKFDETLLSMAEEQKNTRANIKLGGAETRETLTAGAGFDMTKMERLAELNAQSKLTTLEHQEKMKLLDQEHAANMQTQGETFRGGESALDREQQLKVGEITHQQTVTRMMLDAGYQETRNTIAFERSLETLGKTAEMRVSEMTLQAKLESKENRTQAEEQKLRDLRLDDMTMVREIRKQKWGMDNREHQAGLDGERDVRLSVLESKRAKTAAEEMEIRDLRMAGIQYDRDVLNNGFQVQAADVNATNNMLRDRYNAGYAESLALAKASAVGKKIKSSHINDEGTGYVILYEDSTMDNISLEEVGAEEVREANQRKQEEDDDALLGVEERKNKAKYRADTATTGIELADSALKVLVDQNLAFEILKVVETSGIDAGVEAVGKLFGKDNANKALLVDIFRAAQLDLLSNFKGTTTDRELDFVVQATNNLERGVEANIELLLKSRDWLVEKIKRGRSGAEYMGDVEALDRFNGDLSATNWGNITEEGQVANLNRVQDTLEVAPAGELDQYEFTRYVEKDGVTYGIRQNGDAIKVQ